MSKFWRVTLILAAIAAVLGFFAGTAAFGPGGDFLGLVVLAPAYALAVVLAAVVSRAIRRLLRPKTH